MMPTIHIQYSPYLDEAFKALILADPKYKDWVCPTVDQVKEKAALFAKSWDMVGLRLLEGICDKTGLAFRRNYFPIYVVSGNTRSFSNPVVIKSRFSEEEFINTLVHELIHCLFVDNKDSAFISNSNRLFNNDHIVLFAVMESVLPGTVGAILDTNNFPGNAKYTEAMAYVKFVGYKDILDRCSG